MRDRPAGRAVMRQVWEQLGFLHWPVDAAALARLLPPGLDVDLFEGVAYVGIVPFTIPLTRAAGFGARIAPAFHEINVRTYVHRGGRDPGRLVLQPGRDQPARGGGRARSPTGCRTSPPRSRWR